MSSREILSNTVAFIHLFSCPFQDEFGRRFQFLQSIAEMNTIADTLKNLATETSRDIVFKSMVANMKNSLSSIDTTPDILYLAAHGDVNGTAVYMETDRGEMKRWDNSMIEHFFSLKNNNAGKPKKIKCAIVGACFSEDIGRSLVTHGKIDHVVAVKKEEPVEDSASEEFVKNFVTELLNGSTVRAAFEASGLIHQDKFAKFKFVLLPEDKDHNVVLFPPVVKVSSAGTFSDQTIDYQLCCPPPPLCYIFRSAASRVDCSLDALYKDLVDTKRLLACIQACKGCGASTTVIQLAHHAAPRKQFRFIFYVPMGANCATDKGDGGLEQFMHCLVKSLAPCYPWLDKCTSIDSFRRAIVSRLSDKNQRVLLILDDVDDFNTSSITTLMAQITQLSMIVTVHSNKTFMTASSAVTYKLWKLGAMTDYQVARMLVNDLPVHFSVDEIIGDAATKWLLADKTVTPESMRLRVAEQFSTSPVVKTLQGNPLAAQLFKGMIDFTPLVNHEYYRPKAEECVKLAEVHRTTLEEVNLEEVGSPPSETDDSATTKSQSSPMGGRKDRLDDLSRGIERMKVDECPPGTPGGGGVTQDLRKKNDRVAAAESLPPAPPVAPISQDQSCTTETDEEVSTTTIS